MTTFSDRVNSKTGFAVNGTPIAAGPTQAAQATVATADASDLATAIALANALKTSYNQLLVKLRAGNVIAP